jgi:hypothetical protein
MTDAPKHWMWETSGTLAAALKRYLTLTLEGPGLEAGEVACIQAYLRQWVGHPGWQPGGALEALRLRVAAISTAEDINEAIRAAVALGMDPL